VSLALEERTREVEVVRSGGGPARRAIFRWSWRLFRREWRQQVLVLALIVFAVAATVVGVGLAYNAGQGLDPTMGSARNEITFSGSDPADVAAARRAFGAVEEIDHQSIRIPGSVNSLDLRAQDPNGKFGHSTLRLVAGRFPTGAADVAMTRDAATTLDVHISDSVDLDGVTRHVVGLVENPLSLSDEFALVAPGQADPPGQVTILFDAPRSAVDAFRPRGSTTSEGSRSTASKTAIAVLILALETIGLLFVGLVAAAGFAVIAQRRLRALGMLGALGATDRQVRLAMVANGVVVGVVGAVTGAALGFATWIALTPRFEKLVGHRISRFHLQWWAIAASMLLAVVTAVIAASWPARSAARSSIVAALSGRPAPPKPAHRFAGAGAILLAGGLACLAFSHRNDYSPNAFLIVAGIIATTFGMLFVGPLFIRGLAVVGRRAPIALRLALRDLARYQARSAAALGAISLALAIAATVAISAAAAAVPPAEANLANNQLVVYLSSGNGSGPGDGGAAIPVRTAAEVDALQPRVDALAASLHAQSVVALTEASSDASSTLAPDGTVAYVTATLGKERILTRGPRHGVEISHEIPLYIATPALLEHYGINPSDIKPGSDIITGRSDLAGYAVIAPSGGPTPCDPSQPRCHVNGVKPRPGPAPGQRPDVLHPTIQTVKLPTYTSAPDTLLTTRALREFGLSPVTTGWFIQTRSPLTTAQIDSAQRAAASAGITIETRQAQASNAKLRDGATAVGLLVALGVLAMTVGLIRSETAGELRTLAATGATSTTRRTITGATAGALALLGAPRYVRCIPRTDRVAPKRPASADTSPVRRPLGDDRRLSVARHHRGLVARRARAGADCAPATRMNRGAVPNGAAPT
jgi:putative ABC transport system permease protein